MSPDDQPPSPTVAVSQKLLGQPSLSLTVAISITRRPGQSSALPPGVVDPDTEARTPRTASLWLRLAWHNKACFVERIHCAFYFL